ncbi:FKBP-type peptidyl-prolyl cis-trans isomerase [soil metagenome]
MTRTGPANRTISERIFMRLKLFFMLLVVAVGSTACISPTDLTCDVLPTRVTATSGDTVQTVTGLRYIDLTVGTGAEARECRQLEVRYEGRLENGMLFDGGTLGIIPGSRMGFIPGFEQALIGMRAGGTRRAIIPPFLAYGASGAGSIPPNSTLIFDLELVTVIE